MIPSLPRRLWLGFAAAFTFPLHLWRARKPRSGPGPLEKEFAQLRAMIERAVANNPNADRVPDALRDQLLTDLAAFQEEARDRDLDARREAERVAELLSAHRAGWVVALAAPLLPGLLLWALCRARLPLFAALAFGYLALCAAMLAWVCWRAREEGWGEDDEDDDEAGGAP